MSDQSPASAPSAKDLDTKVKLFDTLTKLWTHADIYLWHRARIIVGIQAGVLAGAYATGKTPIIAALILLLGSIVSRVLHLAVKRDEQTRDSYYAYIDPLAKEIFDSPLYEKALSFRMIPPTDSKAPFRAGALLDMTFTGLIVGDLFLACIYVGTTLPWLP